MGATEQPQMGCRPASTATARRTDWPAAPLDDGPRGGQVGDHQGVVEWMWSQEADMASGNQEFRYRL